MEILILPANRSSLMITKVKYAILKCIIGLTKTTSNRQVDGNEQLISCGNVENCEQAKL